MRFLFIGGVNTLFGYGSYSLLIFLGLHYSIALFLATIANVLFNFKTTGHFVYRNRENSLIFRFIMVYVIVYGVNVGSISLLKKIGANEYIAGAIMIIPAAILSYLLNSVFVFKKLESEDCE